MNRLLTVSILALSLAGCASMSRMVSYGNRLADAKVRSHGHLYDIWVHPTDDDLLVQRNAAAASGQGALQGLTFGAVNTMPPKPEWRDAAKQITDPLGCTVTDVYALDNMVTWEATFTCPSGVDLRAIVKAERPDLRAGKPIHPL